MSAHALTQIRLAALAALTGLPTTGTNVVDTNVYPSGPSRLPGLSVDTLNDRLVTLGDSTYKLDRRQVRLQVIARCMPGSGTLQAQTDQIALEVAGALLGSNRTLGGLVSGMRLESGQGKTTGDLQLPAGATALTFLAEYIVPRADPSSPKVFSE